MDRRIKIVHHVTHKQAFNKNRVSRFLGPETLVPAFPRQRNHPVLCDIANAARWSDRQNVSHTQTRTLVEVIFSKPAGEQEAKLVSTGMVEVCHG